MKKLLLHLTVVLFFSSCSSEKLDREKALKLIKEKALYPKPVSYNIFTADPLFAKRMIDAGLEEKGLLTVKRTLTLSESGNPLIIFTDKAKPYLLETPEKDKAENIQLVKIADEDIGEVTGVKMLEGNRAEVEYTTTFKNVTLFSTLSKLKLKKKETHKASFVLYDDGWRME